MVNFILCIFYDKKKILLVGTSPNWVVKTEWKLLCQPWFGALIRAWVTPRNLDCIFFQDEEQYHQYFWGSEPFYGQCYVVLTSFPGGRQAGWDSEVGWPVRGHGAGAELGLAPVALPCPPALSPNIMGVLWLSWKLLNIISARKSVPDPSKCLAKDLCNSNRGWAGDCLLRAGRGSRHTIRCLDSCNQSSPFRRLLPKPPDLLPGPRQL